MEKLNLAGKTFGRLAVIKETGRDLSGSVLWECRCECGEVTETRSYCLVRGDTLSCGCMRGNQLIGKRFGRLRVTDFSHSRGGSTFRKEKYWKCLCDCGSLTTVSSNKLKTGHTKSCGCLRRSVNVSDSESSFYRVYSGYRSNAKKLGRAFRLTENQFKTLTSQKCYYCGSPPATVRHGRKGSPDYIYNGLDRLDNKGGYTVANSVPCCRRDNRLKSDMFTPKETEIMVRALEEFHKNESTGK